MYDEQIESYSSLINPDLIGQINQQSESNGICFKILRCFHYKYDFFSLNLRSI